MFESIHTLPFWLSVAGIGMAWFNVVLRPCLPAMLERRLPWLNAILRYKFGFDWLYVNALSRGVLRMSRFLFQITDQGVIDGSLVGGIGRRITGFAQRMKRFQSGFLYHYVLVMVLGVVVLSVWLLVR